MKLLLLKKDFVISKAIGSVKSYKILKKQPQKDKTYYVKISAKVSVASIKEDLIALNILQESLGHPKIMVVIEEDGEKISESQIIDFLDQKEFLIVDPAIVASINKKNDKLIKQVALGEPSAVSKLCASNGANFIIIGKVKKSIASSEFLKKSEMVSGQAAINAKVIDCSNAQVIASKEAKGSTIHVSKDMAKIIASKKASKNLMDKKLFNKIISAFQNMVNNGISLDITIKNVTSYKLQKNVIQLIKDLSDVASVSKNSFNAKKSQITVLFKGTPDSFCEHIDGKTINGKKVNVASLNGKRITLVVK